MPNQVKKPQPKYGWWGQSNPSTALSGEIGIGSRVYHVSSPSVIGTVVKGPEQNCWVVKWDKYPNQLMRHTRGTLRLA